MRPDSRWFVSLLFCASSLVAQVSGVVSGTVTDSSGAVVSAAAVTAKNVDTGAVRGTVANGKGFYQLFSLPPGEYEIRATKPGFREEIHTGVHLAVDQTATVDLSLSVGEISQQITVSGDAPVVSVAATDISGLVGGQQIRDLPLNGRSYDELSL
jgi:hypothetical protein